MRKAIGLKPNFLLSSYPMVDQEFDIVLQADINNPESLSRTSRTARSGMTINGARAQISRPLPNTFDIPTEELDLYSVRRGARAVILGVPSRVC